MALEKSTEITEIRINDTWNVSVRTDTVIKEDGAEISRNHHRKVLTPFKSRKAGDSWVHDVTDISGEDSNVQDICNAAWTSTVKNKYKAWVEKNREL